MKVKWQFTSWRLLVLYASGVIFGANVVLLVQRPQESGSWLGPTLGAVAMALVSIGMLRSSRARAQTNISVD